MRPRTKAQAPKFVLYGIRGVYNYGTEAIVRGTVHILRRRWPACRIVYASFRPEADRALLEDLTELEVAWAGRVSLAQRVVHRVGRHIGWSHPYELPLNPAIYEDADAVLCIGGDLYTLPPVLSPSMKRFFSPIVQTGERVLAKGVPWVLWAASVGPFETVPPAKAYYVRHLQRLPLITVREPVTQSYLADLGIRANVHPVADPAFALIRDSKSASRVPETLTPSLQGTSIAFNASPLAASYLANSRASMDNFVSRLTQSIERIVENGYRVYLVPHVDAKWKPNDDDYAFLESLSERLRVRSAVKLLDRGLGFFGTKQILEQCGAVFAARMHCGINAVTSGKPAVFLGYSEKARGMSRYVYGNEAMFLPLDQLDAERTQQLLDKLADDVQDLGSSILRRQSQWYLDAMAGADLLSEVI